MSIRRSGLAQKHADLTRQLILDSALRLLEEGSVSELSVRAVAAGADMSERTVFRYYATREDLLDAVAEEMSDRLAAPEPPSTVEELLDYPAAIFARFEATEKLTRAALHSELYHRIRKADAAKRGECISALVDGAAPNLSAEVRRRLSANIHYHVIASTWHYYRFNFGFTAEETIECAKLAIRQSVDMFR
jgi:AcrR family transcriptional regulator